MFGGGEHRYVARVAPAAHRGAAPALWFRHRHHAHATGDGAFPSYAERARRRQDRPARSLCGNTAGEQAIVGLVGVTRDDDTTPT